MYGMKFFCYLEGTPCVGGPCSEWTSWAGQTQWQGRGRAHQTPAWSPAPQMVGPHIQKRPQENERGVCWDDPHLHEVVGALHLCHEVLYRLLSDPRVCRGCRRDGVWCVGFGNGSGETCLHGQQLLLDSADLQQRVTLNQGHSTLHGPDVKP